MRRHSVPRAAGWTPRRRRLSLPGRPRGASLRLLLAILVLPFLVGLAGPPAASGDELSDAIARQKAIAQRLKDQRAEVAKLRSLQAGLAADISSTRAALGGINANLDETKARITRLNGDIAQVRAVYDDLVVQLDQLDRQVGAITDEQAAKARELQQRKDYLAARVREAYRTDRTPLVQAILSAGTFTDVLQDVGSYLDLGAQDQALANRIQADAMTLDALRSLLVETRTAREELRVETANQKRELDARMVDLKAARARLAQLQAETEHQLSIQRAAYADMARNQGALQAAIARNAAAQRQLASRISTLIERQRSQGHIPSQYNGTLRWPMAGTVTQEFGCTGFAWEPPYGSCAHFHQGIDVVAPEGTPVHSAGAGRVVYAGWNYADGADPAWIVIIAHSSNLVTWYAHLQPIRAPGASEGDAVQAGQVIGYEGNTGHSTGAHLHWMVQLDGSFVNPRLFL